MDTFKDVLKALLRRYGFEFRRYNVQTSSDAQLVRALCYLGIDLIMDVGANTGQYGSALRAHGYGGRIVSFEPSSEAYRELIRRASKDRKWTVAPRTALGASSETLQLNLSANSVSNSIRGMLPAHAEAAPESVYVGSEEVPVRTLDAIGPDYMESTNRTLLKIDTQGFEDAVLDGAATVLQKVTALQIELSLIPLYEKQTLLDEMCARVASSGFSLYAVFPVYADEKTGRTLQLDGLFVRDSATGL